MSTIESQKGQNLYFQIASLENGETPLFSSA
jgi:hypothetical protein